MLFRDEDENDELLPFSDRTEAGRVLATKLSTYSGHENVIVLGLPRAGVPVAFEVAHALRLPLDVFVVRKLGTPWHKELAMGAIAPEGVQVLDISLAQRLSVSDEEIHKIIAGERKELKRQERLYRGNRPPLELRAKVVILVDDGIATGTSVLAAIAALRRQKVGRIVVAIAVAPANVCDAIRMEADELICAAEARMFFAVSQWYETFTQTTDEDVRALLKQAAGLVRARPERFRTHLAHDTF
jgi:putative phosphoribosyl transferase